MYLIINKSSGKFGFGAVEQVTELTNHTRHLADLGEIKIFYYSIVFDSYQEYKDDDFNYVKLIEVKDGKA